ncbi:hypothetical protein BASA81_005862 [Batrachochytrium salamandrivorans]|nr:hypothetical protein BASA81_005862 [Batrachochytrium salamandrivorans]
MRCCLDAGKRAERVRNGEFYLPYYGNHTPTKMQQLVRRGLASSTAKKPFSTTEVLFYEYTGLKRLKFIRDGLVPISAYFVVKMYLGSQGMFDHVMASSKYSLAEAGIFSIILGGHYLYLRKLVNTVTLDGPSQTVGVRTFTIFGQPSKNVRTFKIADTRLQTDSRQNILSVIDSNEYFFLERNPRVEKLFPKEQE